MVRLSNALLGLAVLCLAYAALWQSGLAPGSRVILPEPVALERTGSAAGQLTRMPAAVPTEVPVVTPTAATYACN